MLEATNSALIQIENLCKVFKGKRGLKVQALDDVSFTVLKGEIFGFLGPNGAGKSTTIKTLMGLIRPSSGQVLLCGKDSSSVVARQQVGYLSENPVFFDFLTGREYLKFVAITFQMESSTIDPAINTVLERLDLTAAASRLIRGYSKGMVQRLGLAQALLHDPDIYVLDEPMSGLDPQGRALVKDIIIDLGNRGKTVFFSTHITADVEKICDRLAIIAQGQLKSLVSVDEIRQSGVEGYQVIVRNSQLTDLFPGVSIIRTTGDTVIYRSSAESLSELIGVIGGHGGSIELVEPIRQDLEQYFLDVVGRSQQ